MSPSPEGPGAAQGGGGGPLGQPQSQPELQQQENDAACNSSQFGNSSSIEFLLLSLHTHREQKLREGDFSPPLTDTWAQPANAKGGHRGAVEGTRRTRPRRLRTPHETPPSDTR